MFPLVSEDVRILKSLLPAVPATWDGRAAITELKNAGSRQWKQMEWIGFYFEHVCHSVLQDEFSFPGDKYGRVVFDMKRSVNWHLKAKAIKSDSRDTILNDAKAIERSVEQHGMHGLVIAL